MNDNKWPEPPWIAVNDDAYGDGLMHITTVGRSRERKVGIASADVNFNRSIGQENEAAVTLITAAPELYSVLETAVMQGERILNGEPPAEGENFDGWFLAAKAALAKARGEQP